MKIALRISIFFVMVILLSTHVTAQSIEVISLKLIQNDTEGQRNNKDDDQGRKCALFKVRTKNPMTPEIRRQFSFQGDMGTEIVECKESDGELLLYLTAGVQNLRIKHNIYGVIEYQVPITIEGYRTYELLLNVRSSQTVQDGGEQMGAENYVVINVTPSNAIIKVDDVYYPDGQVLLEVGEKYHLEVTCDMYHDYETEIEADPKGTKTIEVELRPNFGYLELTSTPESGAVVLIDGKQVGKTPYKSDRMLSGEYEVQLLLDMYEQSVETIIIKDEGTSVKEIKMKPNFSEVTVVTDSESDIYVDNNKKATGSWKGRVSGGRHRFEARKASHTTSVVTVELTKGQPKTINIDAPTPIVGRLNAKTTPSGASIIIDGRNYGTTPLVTNVIIGTHKVRLEKDGCAPVEKTVTVEENKVVNIDEKLETGRDFTVTTDKSGDDIYVDGSYVGKSPYSGVLPFGSHTIKAKRGAQTSEKTVNVTQNGKYNIKLNIGVEILINSNASNASVKVNGSYVGSTPYRATYNVSTPYEFEVSCYDYKSDKQTHRFTSNDDGKELYFYLKRKKHVMRDIGSGIGDFFTYFTYAITPYVGYGYSVAISKGSDFKFEGVGGWCFGADIDLWFNQGDSFFALASGIYYLNENFKDTFTYNYSSVTLSCRQTELTIPIMAKLNFGSNGAYWVIMAGTSYNKFLKTEFIESSQSNTEVDVPSAWGFYGGLGMKIVGDVMGLSLDARMNLPFKGHYSDLNIGYFSLSMGLIFMINH